MRYFSTRGNTPATGIDQALLAGLADDGGLFVPETIPALPQTGAFDSVASAAQAVLAPYFVDSSLRDALPALCSEAFNFAAPLRQMRGENDWLLELFHGPTAAFKDYAARFLARALGALRGADAPLHTIVVATSGDTGAAVAAAFHQRPGFRVVILYPEGRVSPRQAHGLECWGDNVQAYRVNGSFDDCQHLVKQALADTALRAEVPLGSANSISLGRLLPQIAYHAHCAAQLYAEHGQVLNLIVPTGNLGNACAAWMARAMGLPIGEIALACNANNTLPRYFGGANYLPQATRATLANAMDVGAPSNFERLRHWHHSDTHLRTAMRAISVSDAQIRQTIAAAPAVHGITACPHTACGLALLADIRNEGDTRPWAIAATAHPAKFDTIVEPLTGQTITPPPALAKSLARPAQGQALANDYQALQQVLRGIGI